MKKLFPVLFALVLATALPLTAFAATGLNENEKDILKKLETSVYIDSKGEHFAIPKSYINTAKNYFAGDCDVTDEQTATILDAIDEGIGIVKAEANKLTVTGSKFQLSAMGEEARNQVLALGKQACEEIDLQLTYSPATGKVTITEKGGKTPVFENSAVIKSTGEIITADAAFICIPVIMCLVLSTGAVMAVSKKKGLLEK